MDWRWTSRAASSGADDSGPGPYRMSRAVCARPVFFVCLSHPLSPFCRPRRYRVRHVIAKMAASFPLSRPPPPPPPVTSAPAAARQLNPRTRNDGRQQKKNMDDNVVVVVFVFTVLKGSSFSGRMDGTGSGDEFSGVFYLEPR